MPLGKMITYEVLQVISEVRHAHKDWKAKEIQDEVAREVQKRWPGQYSRNWPGLRAIQQRIPVLKAIDKEIEKEGLDRWWNLGTLRDFPLPAEAIPHILRVQKWFGEELGNFEGVTIREAQWIARLYAIEKISRDTELLWRTSRLYSEAEISAALTDTKFDSSSLDMRLLNEDMAPTDRVGT